MIARCDSSSFRIRLVFLFLFFYYTLFSKRERERERERARFLIFRELSSAVTAVFSRGPIVVKVTRIYGRRKNWSTRVGVYSIRNFLDPCDMPRADGSLNTRACTCTQRWVKFLKCSRTYLTRIEVNILTTSLFNISGCRVSIYPWP